MSTPLATNREPAYGETPGVLTPFRFSARGDGVDLDQDLLEFHVGAGPVFWKGGILPEENSNSTFTLKALNNLPAPAATRTVMLNESLRLEKLMMSQNQAAIYECGALEAPADPQDPIMLQFTLSLAQADVVADAYDQTGVMVGLKINNTGVNIKFLTFGGVRRIEIHYAQYVITAPPSLTYRSLYDWDQGQPHTYKLLWHPKLDILRLYVSSGQGSDSTDVVLIDGSVSDILAFGPLPEVERPRVQPVAYFGHGYIDSTSISYWHEFYLHNKVSSPLVEGLFQGEHTGFIKSDEVVWYRPTALLRSYERPWPLLPVSFDDMGGVEELTTQNELWLTRVDESKSFGFFRKETELKYGPSIFDFKISGELLKRALGIGESTGMEAYVDDGTRQLRFALLDAGGTQSVGLLSGSNPAAATSYLATQGNWVNQYSYRLILDPTGNTNSRLIRLSSAEGGVEEVVLAEIAYSSLPATVFPGPSFGVLHNGNTIAAQARMKLGRMRYSTKLIYSEGNGDSNVLWSVNDLSKGTIQTTVLEETELNHNVTNSPFYVFYGDSKLTAGRGFFFEFRGKATTFEVDGLVNPIRRLCGVGVGVDDGTYQYLLMFADMGPPNGKIVFLATNADLEQNLLDIRAGAPSVAGTYAIVDWTKHHIYRLEKSVGGVTYDVTPKYSSELALYIDDAEDPAIELSSSVFTPIPTEGFNRIRFGSLLSGRSTLSLWKYFRYATSSGFDVSAMPRLSEAQVSQRFDNGLNTIAEVWTV